MTKDEYRMGKLMCGWIAAYNAKSFKPSLVGSVQYSKGQKLVIN